MVSPLVAVVVSPIVSNVLGIASSLATNAIKNEVNLYRDLKKDLEKLSSSLSSIQAVLSSAEERQLTDPSVRDWLVKLKYAACDAEDILKTYETEMLMLKRKQVRSKRFHLSSGVGIDKSLLKLDAAHDIKKIAERLSSIAQERRDFQLPPTPANVPRDEKPHTSSWVDTTHVFGRDADKEKLIELLLSENSEQGGKVSVIPIIGMGGLGKTTLAQLVFNDKRVEDHFILSRMWVCVTVDFELTRILRDMIESYSKMPLPQSLTPSLVESRFREFLPGKRFLLVLDDAWSRDYNRDWLPLLQLLELGERGSKVLVTSRTQRVADIVGTQPTHHLELLPEDPCWSLFKKIACRNGNFPGNGGLENIGRGIVRKCNGLPLAVRAMAGILRGNTDENKWRKVLESDLWDLEEDAKHNGETPGILPALKLSYSYLPPYLKQCFAFCSIFPKAYDFNRKELVKIWVAQAFIQPRGQERLEETGIEYFDELSERSFFQLLDIKNRERYRMHDLIHDLAQSIFKSFSLQIKDIQSSGFKGSDSYLHMSFLCQDVEQPLVEVAQSSTRLRTILTPVNLLKNFGQALDKSFASMKYIRVLDLSSSSIHELPSSIQKLKLLHYLDLSMTEIKELPDSICNLYNLQTLKLLGCPWLFKLPRAFGDLVNLCHLEVDEMFWFKCTSLPPHIGNLKGLQNLHAFRVSRESGYEIKQLMEMEFLTGRLHISNLQNAEKAEEAKLNEKERLQKLVFEWTSEDVSNQDEATQQSVLQDLQPHPKLEELQIIHYKGASFPSWITDGRLQNLVSIYLNHCTKCKILSFDQVPQLQILRMKGMQELEKLECPSLRVLRISDCNKLSVLTEFLPNLAILKIKKCSSLKALPIAPFLQFLILIDNCALEDWREVMLQITFMNDQGQHRGQMHSFQNLLEMKVVQCPQLQALPRIFAPQKLEISKCELLPALPGAQFSQRLQQLALDACNAEMLSTMPHTTSLFSLTISNVSALVMLPRWPQLPGLKALYVHNCVDLVSLDEDGEVSAMESFSSLKVLSIRGCEKLATLPKKLPNSMECLSVGSCRNLQSLGPQGTLRNLECLKDLYIEDCPQLQSFPDDGLPTSLQHLCIHNCSQLTQRCHKNVGAEWQKIKDIPDLEIDFVKVCSSPPLPNKNPSPAPWYRRLFCGRGMNIITDIEDSIRKLPQQSGTLSTLPATRGKNLKLKVVQGEPSTLAAPSGIREVKTEQGEPSTQSESGIHVSGNGQPEEQPNLLPALKERKGKQVIIVEMEPGEPSNSTETGKSNSEIEELEEHPDSA